MTKANGGRRKAVGRPVRGPQNGFHVHRHGGSKIRVVVTRPLTKVMVGKLIGALLEAVSVA